MKFYTMIPVLVAAGLLSACDSNNPAATSQVDRAIGFASDLETRSAAEEITLAGENDLPDNAKMSGFLTASNDEGRTLYVGDADADFDFESATLIGSAKNFNEYEMVEACAIGFEDCTGEKTRGLNGSLTIVGNIEGTGFGYNADGVLTAEDEEFGTVVARVSLFGGGDFYKDTDDKLYAYGTGGGNADLFTTTTGGVSNGEGEGFALDNVLILKQK